MLSLWDVASLTMVAFWHFLAVDDFLLLSSSGVQTNTARNDDHEDNVALRVRCLTEALPENRFYRLLHKHQFDAAARFAKQFNLDIELVYKVRANTLLDKVSQWTSNHDQNDFNFGELKECLSKIKEDEYVINCCLQAVLPTIEETYTTLRYARERASQKDTASGTTRYPRLLNEILTVLDKLVTFQNAYGVKQFSGSRWHSFRHADLLAEVQSCFGQSEVSSAVTIWRKHQSSFAKDFSMEKLESLFGSIGQNLQSSLIVPWLRDYLVPFVFKVLPQGIDVLALWLEQRARKMELSEKRGWPSNALDLIRVLPAPTHDSSTKGDQSTTSSKENGLVRLAELLHYLSELLELHNKYSCRISLAEYSQETTKTIVFRLLDSVKAAELMPQYMKKFIAPYMIHYGLDKDQVLLEYTKLPFFP
ncbi:hypothetical protein QZH41_009193 [Actinostola sp. cb2023]|nr:hypothetical protein QZH41_009193 [Actinostola sp. cb2023]